jgi:hypothetical protein
VIVERERPRVAKQEPEKDAADETVVDERPAPVAVATKQRNLEYFRKLLKEIQEDLALSDWLSGWIEKLDGTESVGFIINMDDGEETEETVPPVITGVQKQAIDPAQENFIALRSMHDWLDDVRYEFMYNPPPENKKNEAVPSLAHREGSDHRHRGEPRQEETGDLGSQERETARLLEVTRRVGWRDIRLGI